MTPKRKRQQRLSRPATQVAGLPPYLNRTALAKLLGRHISTVERWLNLGLLPKPHTRIGASPVWDRDKILEWVEAGKCGMEKSA